jgi:hypothetical protein
MEVNKQTPLDTFRASLEDVATLARHLSTMCVSIQELVEVCELGASNDAQLKILYSLVTRQNQARKT